jgi:hypothetical protein
METFDDLNINNQCVNELKTQPNALNTEMGF